jgi:hypothetical protein
VYGDGDARDGYDGGDEPKEWAWHWRRKVVEQLDYPLVYGDGHGYDDGAYRRLVVVSKINAQCKPEYVYRRKLTRDYADGDGDGG